MTDTPNAAPDRLHSLPLYRLGPPCDNATQSIVVTQSAAACTAFVGELQQPLVLNGETPDFAQRLQAALHSATVGSHLYLMGDEAFIWRVHAEARAAGMEDAEITLSCSLGGPRLVYCVHCGLSQAAGPQPVLICVGCDVALEVRSHFSRRLGAYLGVCVDPDQPFGRARS